MQRVSSLDRSSVSIPAETIYLEVQSAVTQWISAGCNSSLDAVLESLPLDQLEKAIRSQNMSYGGVLRLAKECAIEADYYLRHREKRESEITIGVMICEALIACLEGLLDVFGIADFFEPAESAFQASTKFQKVMMLTSFTFLTTELVPMLGTAISGLIIGALLLTLIVLSLIYPYIRPLPTKIPHTTNWTRQIQEGTLPMAYERKNIRDLLAESLISSQTIKKYPMLIGKTRVGKTQAAIAFAHAVARGDYKELKDKTVFYVNAADLIAAGDPFGSKAKALEALKKGIGRHKESAIFIIDEIHLTQRPENKAIGDQLKMLLDQGEGSLPYVIGITTEEDFYRDIYRSDFAFTERFKKIPVDNTTDAETLSILSSFLLKEASEVLIDDDVLPALLEKTQGKVQPASALHILSRSITKVRDLSLEDQKIASLRERIAALHTSRVASSSPFRSSEEIVKLEEELTTLVQKLDAQKKEIQSLLTLRMHVPKIKEEAFRSALKVANLQASIEEQKRFLLLTQFVSPLLEKYLREKGASIGFPIAITKELLQTVVEEEEVLAANIAAHIQSGAASIRERELLS